MFCFQRRRFLVPHSLSFEDWVNERNKILGAPSLPTSAYFYKPGRYHSISFHIEFEQPRHTAYFDFNSFAASSTVRACAPKFIDAMQQGLGHHTIKRFDSVSIASRRRPSHAGQTINGLASGFDFFILRHFVVSFETPVCCKDTPTSHPAHHFDVRTV